MKKLINTAENQNGNTIIIVLTLIVLVNIILASVFLNVKSSLKTTGRHRLSVSALNAAESGKEHLYSAINSGAFTPTTTKTTVFDNVPFGKSHYTVTCYSNFSKDTLHITSEGVEGNRKKTLEITTAFSPKTNINQAAASKAAIVSRYNVNLTGNIEVDGRDYDSNNILVGSGVYGIYTCMSASLQGSAVVGGNSYIPVGKKDFSGATRAAVVAENQPFSNIFDSPEQFLGIPDGSLDEYKVTSISGPFHGIKYVTNDCSISNLGSSSGILIVHNTNKTAQLALHGNGSFKGIIICDQMNKINGSTTVLGTVATLSGFADSWFGNGNAQIHYSSQVLSNIHNYASIKLRLNELSWRELD